MKIVAAPAVISKWRHAVLYGDTHIPFHDPKALAVVLGVIRDVRPQTVVDMGDTLDCYTVSKYDKSTERRHSLQDEIDQGVDWLEQVVDASPSARHVLLDSNHFRRLSHTINRMSLEQREIAQLREFQRAMNWPVLLDLKRLGFEWVPESVQTRSRILPKAILKHGTKVASSSAMSARAEYTRLHRSGASGHTHRMGSYFHRDVDGGHLWVETGCTCLVSPEYLTDGYADWHQGVTIWTHTPDGSRFHVEQLYIENGRGVSRTHDYQTTKDRARP